MRDHSVWKSQKKSHSKIFSLRSNNVIRQVNLGQEIVGNAKNCKNSKWDILGDFQTLCSSASRYSNYRFSSRQKIARIFALVWWLTFFLEIQNQTDWRFEEEFLLGWVRRIAAPPQCEAPAPKNFNSTWGQFQYLFQSSKKSFQTF